ncbi:MAG TPA: hypothetical protein VG713_04415, partial [Pirellulales bacterium]|nr:hypothetical protein [Pirellulales bacterium]
MSGEMIEQPDSASWDAQARLLGWTFVGLGITVRLVRYLLCFPLWGDECMLADNLLDANMQPQTYAALLEPMEHCQVAPLGYVWSVLTAVKLFGFNPWALRLVALAGGIGTLLLMRVAATRLLRPTAAMFATGLCACAYYPIRHAVELKPYATDMFFSAALVTLAILWFSDARRTRWLWALVAVAPVAIVSSFPALFVAGGVGLGLFVAARGLRFRGLWLPLLAYGCSLVASFALVFFVSNSAQSARSGEQMRGFWESSFPPS